MSLMCVGMSHRSAGIEVLERCSTDQDERRALLDRMRAGDDVDEVAMLATCNRVEVYASVSSFHGGIAELVGALAEHSGIPVGELAKYLYVHYQAEAVRHAFRVVAGLDSMVVGESQILGQFRDAYTIAAEHGCVAAVLHDLMQQALRVGKRAQSETEIDRAGRSVMAAAVERAEALTGPLEGRSALVVGAGAMGAMALATLRRSGAGKLFVANRGLNRAVHLAAGYDATAVALSGIQRVLAEVDVVVTATAATTPVLSAETVTAAMADPGRSRGDRLLILDLAVPRNVEPCVTQVEGVILVDMRQLSTSLPDGVDAAVGAAEEIVETEVAGFLTRMRGESATPTVAALRARADDVVTAELARLGQRCPDLTEHQRDEVAKSIHRVVQQLLHQPTVRMRELAAAPGGENYVLALRELFDLQVPDRMDERRQQCLEGS